MTDPNGLPTLPTGWRANPVIARLLSAHFWMAVAATILLGVRTRPWAQPYLSLIDTGIKALGGGALVTASLYKTPTTLAKEAHVDALGLAAVHERVVLRG